MHQLIVRGNTLTFGDKTYTCAVGKAGFSAHKREGDNATPLGIFPLRECWYRPDKHGAPATGLPLHALTPEDGWCDAPESPDYNRHVILPYDHRHEKLWRTDDVYDLIIPLGYNDEHPIPGKGSAIFMHVAKPGYEGTEGYVALAREDLLELLAQLGTHSMIEIHEN